MDVNELKVALHWRIHFTTHHYIHLRAVVEENNNPDMCRLLCHVSFSCLNAQYPTTPRRVTILFVSICGFCVALVLSLRCCCCPRTTMKMISGSLPSWDLNTRKITLSSSLTHSSTLRSAREEEFNIKGGHIHSLRWRRHIIVILGNPALPGVYTNLVCFLFSPLQCSAPPPSIDRWIHLMTPS